MLPIAPLAGPNLVSALPAIVLFNTLILLPVALLSIYGIAARIAGRLFGYWAVALWIAIPYLGIVFLEPGYHQKYTELTLPQLLGLTSVPDFPSVVALLVGALLHAARARLAGLAFAGRSRSRRRLLDRDQAVELDLPRGTGADAARASGGAPCCRSPLALAPALLTLAVWKYRGLGELAAAPAEPVRLAGGDDLFRRIHNNELNSWAHLDQVLLALREHFWVARLMVWLPLAGLVALAIRSRRGLTARRIVVRRSTSLLKGTYLPASIDDASFWRILMPAFPAYVLLDRVDRAYSSHGLRARPDGGAVPIAGRRLTVAFAVALVVFAAAPLAVIAATPQLHDNGTKAVRFGDIARSGLRQRRAEGELSTRTPSTFPGDRRTLEPDEAVLPRPARAEGGTADGELRRPQNASDDCRLYMDPVGTTAGTSFVDRPGPGTWTYSIGVSANWLNDFALGDVYFVSRPVTVTVP